MPNIYEGSLCAEGCKFAIIVSRFNEFLTFRLMDGAIDALKRNGAIEENIDIFKVPGSFEIPLTAKKITSKEKYDAVICVGAVIQGDTSHHKYVSQEVTKGIASVSLESGIPVAFGIITTDNLEQAIERSGTKVGNKGWDAAMTAIEMVSLNKEIEKRL